MIYRISKTRDWSKAGVAVSYYDIENPHLDVLKDMYSKYDIHMNRCRVMVSACMYFEWMKVYDLYTPSIYEKFLSEKRVNKVIDTL